LHEVVDRRPRLCSSRCPTPRSRTSTRRSTARRGRFSAWRAVAPVDRARLLRRVAQHLEANLEELAALESRNAGKPIGDARGEMSMVVDTFAYYAGARSGCSATRSRSPAAWR
jgi:acyl-CoA reductase-like NAD-dependent aldehyde dehydrogenase